MKLWDSLTTCLILLSAVVASPLLRSRHQTSSTRRRVRAAESPLELPPVQIRLSVAAQDMNPEDWEETMAGGDKCKSVKSPTNILKRYFHSSFLSLVLYHYIFLHFSHVSYSELIQDLG